MPWWYDTLAVAQTLKLRDQFMVTTFVETGCFRGINLKFWSYRFDNVIGVDKSEAYANTTRQRCNDRRQVSVYHNDSAAFLRSFVLAYRAARRTDIPFLYLDAHFYDPAERWVVKRELRELQGFPQCIIAIHDFQVPNEPDLGHLIYDGEPLSFAVVRDDLAAINPDFSYYTNSREWSVVHTAESISGLPGLTPDADTLETIVYHHRDWRKYRGILYCTPTPLDLCHYQLRELQ